MTNKQMVRKYLEHCEDYYGTGPRSTTAAVELAVRPLVALCGHLDGLALSDLKRIRLAMLEANLARSTINARIDKIVRMFRWLECEDYVPPGTYHRLRTLAHLKRGRSKAVDPPKRQPVDARTVQATLEKCPPLLQDMLAVQWFTGCRSGSLVAAHSDQFICDNTHMSWHPKHKTAYLDHEVELPIGPKCQKILRPLLKRKGPLFLHRRRSTYTTWSYRRAIVRIQQRYNLLPFTPHQLRHARANLVRSKLGVEAAQAVLGHRTVNATQLYAGRQLALAREAAEKYG